LQELRTMLADVLESRHDDQMLWRFLKAREFKPEDSAIMFRETLAWRSKNGIDSISETWGSPTNQKRIELEKYVASSTHGVDKRGCPVVYDRVGSYDTVGLIAAFTTEEMIRHHIYTLEKIQAEKLQISQKQKFYVLKHLVVVDLEHMGMSHLGSGFMSVGKELIHTDESHYPEISGKLFIVNAPWAFGAAWRIIKPWLADRTVQKVDICSADYLGGLLKDIDSDQIPREYGGTCKSCPGTGRCLPQSPPIPQSLYRANMSTIPNATPKVFTVSSGSKTVESCGVTGAGSNVAFEMWITDNYDVGLTIDFIGMDGKKKNVKPSERISSEKGHFTDVLISTEAGKYIFEFDNSYSFFRSKEVHWVLQVTASEKS